MKVTKLLWLCLISTTLFAQKNGGKESVLLQSEPLVYAEQQTLYSSVYDDQEQINIYLPESYHEASNHHKYPVIVTVEDEFFYVTTGVVKHLSSVNRMPEAIVVSIIGGPVVPEVYVNGSTNWPSNWKTVPFGGDADKFADYLEKDLFPYLEQNYRAANYRVVLGFSGTSIFTFHALIKRPELFQAHVAIAAGDILGMGYHEGESFIDSFEKSMQQNPNRKGNLYVISADSDLKDDAIIQENLDDLRKRLAPYAKKNLKLISKVYPNEGHYHVVLPALGEAMNLIFPIDKWFPSYREMIQKEGTAMSNIDAFYENLSKEYGFPILPRAERWNNVNCLRWIGQKLIKEERFEEAIEVLQRRVMYRPTSALAYQSLAQAYEANQQLTKAILTQKQAVEFAQKGNEKEVERFTNYLTELMQQKTEVAD